MIASIASLLTLSGSNTYTGGTTVSAGTLSVAAPMSLSSYGTSGKLSVAHGATLYVSGGGSGQWTAGNIGTLLANTGFSGGTGNLEIDTSNATGGLFDISNEQLTAP